MSFIPRFTLFIPGFICTGDDRWTMRYQPGGTHFLFVNPVHGRVNFSLAKPWGHHMPPIQTMHYHKRNPSELPYILYLEPT